MKGESLVRDLAAALRRATREPPAEALLLSGGVDSAVIAALHPEVPAITVGLARDPARQPTECSTCAATTKRLACGDDLTPVAGWPSSCTSPGIRWRRQPPSPWRRWMT